MKHKWQVVFDGDRTHPWVVRPEKGSEAFFATVRGTDPLSVGGYHLLSAAIGLLILAALIVER
jgi:hypothetical protein